MAKKKEVISEVAPVETAQVKVKASAEVIAKLEGFIANAGGTGFVTVSAIQLQKLVDALKG